MKKRLVILLVVLVIGFSTLHSAKILYQPYVLAGIEKGEFSEVAGKVETLLGENGFVIAGKYNPLKDPNRLVYCVTHELLDQVVEKLGDLTAFALVTRVGIYKNDKGEFEISYMNAEYWGNAFCRKQYSQVEKNYLDLKKKMAETFKTLAVVKNEPYGSEDGGLTAKKLHKFHVGIFQPYYDDVYVLAKKTNYDEVLKKIEKNLEKKVGGVEKVFSYTPAGKKLTLYGVALFGENGELKYTPPVEKQEHKYKHITSMPFTFLVMENKVIMLHAKYSVPIGFPDAGMGTFMKIMRAPGRTHDYIEEIVTAD